MDSKKLTHHVAMSDNFRWTDCRSVPGHRKNCKCQIHQLSLWLEIPVGIDAYAFRYETHN